MYSSRHPYVLAKDIGEAGAATAPNFPTELAQPLLADRFNTRYDRGNLPGSRRNRFLLTGLVPLPFGRGRTIGSHWNGPEQALMGGWKLSTVTMIQSGPYQTPTTNAQFDQSNTNISRRGVQARPDRVGNGNLANPTQGMYYDKSAFVPVPAGPAVWQRGRRNLERAWHYRNRRRPGKELLTHREAPPSYGRDLHEPTESPQLPAAEREHQ